MLEPGAKLNQRYTIRQVLSRGLLSNVYEAEDGTLQRRVVLKQVVSNNGLASAARLQREVALYARLRHPNIVPLLDLVAVEKETFLVFPLLEGPTLAEMLARGPMLMTTGLGYARDIASALAFVHAQKIVHRDLKPANVMIDDGHAVLVDFGIAKESETDGLALTRSGQTLGTPLYMAPEAMRNEAVGAPADVYALGVVMFEALAGQPPFSGRNFAELVANRLKESPPPLVQVRADVPAAVSRLVQQMLEPLPATRPTAAQVCDALNVALASPVNGLATEAPGLLQTAEIGAPSFSRPTPAPQASVPPMPAPPPRPPSGAPLRPPPGPPPPVPAWPTASATMDPELSRTVSVRGEVIATTVEERPDSELRGFFNDELSRQVELQRSREFYRTQLSEDYGTLMVQARISFALWVLFSFVGFAVLVAGIVLLYLGKWQQGAATLVSEAIVVFIQKLFKDREDEFRERAAKKNRHVELGNLWNLAAQSLDGLDAATRRDKLGKLTDAIIEQVGK